MQVRVPNNHNNHDHHNHHTPAMASPLVVGAGAPCCAGRRRGSSSSWSRSLTRPLLCNDRSFVVTVQKTFEVAHLQLIDKVLTVPVETSSYGGYGAVNCGIFRTPSSWTSSARLAATFLSPRWPTVVGRRGLLCCAAVFLNSISTETSLSIYTRSEPQPPQPPQASRCKRLHNSGDLGFSLCARPERVASL